MNLLRGAVARAQLLVCWLSRLGTLPALLGDAPPGVDAPSPLPRLPFGLCLTTGSSLSWQPFLLCFSEWDSVAVGVPSALSFDSVCIAATLSSCASVVLHSILVVDWSPFDNALVFLGRASVVSPRVSPSGCDSWLVPVFLGSRSRSSSLRPSCPFRHQVQLHFPCVLALVVHR